MTTTPTAESTVALRRALRRGIGWAVALGAVTAAVLAGIALAVDGRPGLWGALVGIVVAGSFVLVTAVVGLVTVGRDPLVMGTALLGSWLVKAVVAIGVLVAVRSAEGIETLWVGVGILVGVVATLAAQARALLTARVPYVDTSSRSLGTDTPTSSQ